MHSRLSKVSRLSRHSRLMTIWMWDAGGNMDNRRIGVGASMYYPVSVEGALLSMGDAHSAQGDSEFDGKSLTQKVYTQS